MVGEELAPSPMADRERALGRPDDIAQPERYEAAGALGAQDRTGACRWFPLIPEVFVLNANLDDYFSACEPSPARSLSGTCTETAAMVAGWSTCANCSTTAVPGGGSGVPGVYI